MKKTINDMLLQLGEAAQEQRLSLSADMALYQKLSKHLPRLFPAPDEFYTRSAVATEYDASFVYTPNEGEHPEALRIMLSMLFGLPQWQIEIDKQDLACSLLALKQIENYFVLFRITGVDAKFYDYVITTDSGMILSGPVECKKFVPLDERRQDVSPEVFSERLKEISYRNFIHAKQAQICSLAAIGFPTNTPVPDQIEPALGMNYDLDITYLGDPKGKLRSKIDAILGYKGWSGVIMKTSGMFSLHTLLPLACQEYTLQVRLSIIPAHQSSEQLFIVADIPDRLIYKSVRPSDPDFVATVEAAKNEAS